MKEVRLLGSDTSGFKLGALNGENNKDYKWSEVKDVEIVTDGLVITTDGQDIFINKQWSGWHKLLKEVPVGYKSFNNEFVSHYFSQMKGCEICGLKAVVKDECLNCCAEVWGEEVQKSYDSKEEYLREEQLMWFEPEENEYPDINNRPDDGFESWTGWKPVITDEDIRSYSYD
ncbi:hypothetical protein [Fulvivirga ligni]|uniref:hypothetical protein n=1 Tax=Fulvivirga ligni TaxID=2904246 RepID=UPI001F1A0A8C|nr:hypothetical protein [Fulvivirga ligni]UII22231.1 hypothetical protein LVD16_03175 [Fulvivirga ligni]